MSTAEAIAAWQLADSEEEAAEAWACMSDADKAAIRAEWQDALDLYEAEAIAACPSRYPPNTVVAALRYLAKRNG